MARKRPPPEPAPNPALPCTSLPGSEAKVALLAARLAARLPLYVPGDAGVSAREILPPGIDWDNARGKYRVRAQRGKRVGLVGRYDTREEAVAALEAAERNQAFLAWLDTRGGAMPEGSED